MFKSPNSLHHAYLLVGGVEEAEKELHSFFHSHNIALIGSPDYFLWKLPLFGIDEARELNVQAVRKAFGVRKIFFIAPEKVTHEAQNALLKTFEEPYPDTHFFLVMREEGLALPTLRSRMQVLRVSSHEGRVFDDAKKFISLPVTGRLAFAKKFADAERSLSAFLDELLLLLKSQSAAAPTLAQVYKARLVSDDRAASARLILEHLSLVL